MIKGTIINNALVVDYSYQGMGVVKIDNFTIFVPGVKIGDVLTIEITELKKKFGFAVAKNYEFKKVACKYYYTCGSCNLMHIPYDQQLALKQKVLSNLVAKNMIHTELGEFMPAPDTSGYRNKISLPVQLIDGKLQLGYYKRGSHQLIPIDNCLLANSSINNVIGDVELAFNELSETAYNYKVERGNIRHIVLRGTKDSIMVIVVTASGKLKNEQLFVDLLARNPLIKSIVINRQGKKNRVILGANNRVIYGCETIELNLFNLDFNVRPNAFFQVNGNIATAIIDYIAKLISFKDKVILDAFCGTGTLGLTLASKASKIIGIEIDREAVSSARDNANKLKLENVEYICDDIEKVINSIDTSDFNVGLIDPPRSGLATNMKQSLLKMKIEELVYISCEPSTLMRDIGELAVFYEVESIKGFDMFPNTNHIETVAYLKLRKEQNG